MNGLHLIADLHDCQCAPELLLNAQGLCDWCVAACRRHGLTVVGHFFHQFSNAAGHAAGGTGAVILAESHLAIHTWPELNAATLDIYVCNFSADNSQAARALFSELIGKFQATRSEIKEVLRGQFVSDPQSRT